MFGRDIYTPKPEILFEPRPLRTTSIAQVYSPSFIRELGTQRPYHETYAFWINPENIITTQDLEAYTHIGKAKGSVTTNQRRKLVRSGTSGTTATGDAQVRSLKYPKSGEETKDKFSL